MSGEVFTQLVAERGEEVGGLTDATEDSNVNEGEEGVSVWNTSLSSSTEDTESEEMSAAVSRVGMWLEIPLMVINASASQNVYIFLVLIYFHDPSAIFALWLYEHNN